jgi:hypothetical protein
MTPFEPGEPKTPAAFPFVRARELATEIDALAQQLVALVGHDYHIPPRVAAVRSAAAILLAEMEQVARDARRNGWDVHSRDRGESSYPR